MTTPANQLYTFNGPVSRIPLPAAGGTTSSGTFSVPKGAKVATIFMSTLATDASAKLQGLEQTVREQEKALRQQDAHRGAVHKLRRGQHLAQAPPREAWGKYPAVQGAGPLVGAAPATHAQLSLAGALHPSKAHTVAL